MGRVQESRPAGSREAPGASGRGLAFGCRRRGPAESAPETRPVSSATGAGARVRVVRETKEALEPGHTARQRRGGDAGPCRQPAGSLWLRGPGQPCRHGLRLPESVGRARRCAAPAPAGDAGRLRRPSLLILTVRRALPGVELARHLLGSRRHWRSWPCDSRFPLPFSRLPASACLLPLAARLPCTQLPAPRAQLCLRALGNHKLGKGVGQLSQGETRISLF